MKVYLFVIAICWSFLSLAQPKIAVDRATVKFDKVSEGKVLHHTFKVTNVGDAPLLLNSYNVGCPCTKVTLPKQPIAPGQTVEIPMEFDSKGKYGFQDRSIFISTNVPKLEDFILRFKVVVK